VRERERNLMDLRAMMGLVLALLGVVCAVVGIFVLEGISIEFPGIILGGLGYYFGFTSQNRASQILGIAAAVLNVISMVISGLSGPPQ
jgi:uncharacterized RDD family membrane protein YckC